MGKALEDDADYAASFEHYSSGNRLRRSQLAYDADEMSAFVRESMALYSAEFFASRAGFGATDPDPIFIVGLPRAGSTLIEQILASHPSVEGTMELPDMLAMAGALAGKRKRSEPSRYPAELANLSADTCRELGERYIGDTRIQRKTAKPFFIDKMPNNFRHIGLIHLILPRARIIDARRDPMSCCFSNLKQLFAQGQEFTYSIEDIARYYRTYLDLMRHWDDVLPGRVLRVQHEDVVDDLSGSVRRILEYCNLPFERACVDFHKNTRSVRTPSSEQVRQPIFRDGLDQWKKFEPWLEPLKRALGDAFQRYRA
jgi:hypothetical protein